MPALATLALLGALAAPPGEADPMTEIEFRYRPPQEISEVSLVGEMNGWDPKATPMARGADGAWSVKVRLAPGQWLYKFHSGAQWLADPENPLSSPDGHGGRHSFLLVGDGDFRRHEQTPHGRLEVLRVPSKALAAEVEVSLYTPPGAQGKLPLLVLVHGKDMDRLQWVDNGLIADFMDNLIAARRVVPFMVAMPSVMPFSQQKELRDFLADELPRWLTTQRKAASTPSSRALGGFSMGGGLTLLTAAEHPSSFGVWLPLAPAVSDEALAAWGPSLAKAGPIVQWCGVEDHLLATNEKIAARLQELGADAQYIKGPGAHSFRFLNGVTPDLLVRASRQFEHAR